MRLSFAISTVNLTAPRASMFNLSRVTEPRLRGCTARMSSRPTAPSHYDALEVKSDATQSEIKSAYYKLTMQYHPDKNRSEGAKTKFQAVSDAYEVLGNYQSRKVYDRSIMVQKGISYSPKARYHEPVAQHHHPADHPVFDYDAWTRAHYGTLFSKHMEKKQMHREREEIIRIINRNREENKLSSYLISYMFVVGVIYAMYKSYAINSEGRKKLKSDK